MAKYQTTAEWTRCTVIARLGQHDLIEVEHRRPDTTLDVSDLPLGIEPCEVLSSETISTQVLMVRAESACQRGRAKDATCE